MGFHRFNCIADTMLTFIQFSANTGVLFFCWTYRYMFLCCILPQKHPSGVLAAKKKKRQNNFPRFIYCNIIPSCTVFLLSPELSFVLHFVFTKAHQDFLARRCGLQLLFFICCFVKRDCKMQWGFAVRN